MMANEAVKRLAFKESLLSLSFNEAKNDRWICDTDFRGKRDGCFLEAGAASGRESSSCFLLEKKFGWKGICVESNGYAEVKNSFNTKFDFERYWLHCSIVS